jgi:hypothetical protein
MLGSGQAPGVLEQLMRAALTSAGARLLEAVLAGEDGYAGPHAKCGSGHQGRLRRRPGQNRDHRAGARHAAPGVVSLRGLQTRAGTPR